MSKRYLLFHKPYGVLTQFTEQLAGHTTEHSVGRATRQFTGQPAKDQAHVVPPTSDRLTLKSFIPVSHVYPVGRLDRDSEGLLLLTNDGLLQHRLTDPKFHHPRTYWVQVERIPTFDDLEPLRRGVMIKKQRTRPAIATLLSQEPNLPPRNPPIRYRKTVPTAWLELTLTEGRNRQVRRMTASIGFPTLRLVRVAIGALTLAGLNSGRWRDLTPSEVKQLKRW